MSDVAPVLLGAMRNTFVACVLGLLSVVACSGKEPDKDAPAGCAKDTDCKGSRVCISGVCTEPPPAQSASAPSTAASATAARPTAAPSATQAAGGSAFRAAAESEWRPLIGPRLRKGAVVAHQVFEGPLGPSAKSLFVVTRESDGFYATAWAEGRGYRAGPLANNGGTPAKIAAVSFFDADGDGSLDALVMATYSPPGGGAEKFDNALLRWSGTALVRMVNLEPAIAALESVAAVRAKLKR